MPKGLALPSLGKAGLALRTVCLMFNEGLFAYLPAREPFCPVTVEEISFAVCFGKLLTVMNKMCHECHISTGWSRCTAQLDCCSLGSSAVMNYDTSVIANGSSQPVAGSISSLRQHQGLLLYRDRDLTVTSTSSYLVIC